MPLLPSSGLLPWTEVDRLTDFGLPPRDRNDDEDEDNEDEKEEDHEPAVVREPDPEE